MDLATIFGLITGTGLIIASMIMKVVKEFLLQNLEYFRHANCIRGTIAATSVAFRMNEVTRVLLLIKFALYKPKFISHELVQTFIDLQN